MTRPNTVTTTNEYPLWIVQHDGKPVMIRVMVGVRDEVVQDMETLTFKRFSYACQMLASGYEWHPESKSCIKAEFRPDSWFSTPSSTSEARISIWVRGDGIPVYTPNGIITLEINVFTELTSIENFVEIMQMVAFDDAAMREIGEQHKPGTKPQRKESELDKAFPRDSNGQSARHNPAQQVDGKSDSDYIGGYDHKKKDEYIRLYGGGTVRADVLRMKRVWNQNDGSPEIEVFSSWNGSLSKYPAYSLKIKHKRLSEVDDYTRSILTPMFDAPRNETPENTISYYGSYMMFVPKDNSEKLYPLLVKLTPKPQPTEHPQPAEQPALLDKSNEGDLGGDHYGEEMG